MINECDMYNSYSTYKGWKSPLYGPMSQVRKMMEFLLLGSHKTVLPRIHLQNSHEELAALYHHVCHVNGEQPNRVMLDHAAASGKLGNSLTSSPGGSSGPTSLRFDAFKDKLTNVSLLENWKSGNHTSIECNRVVDTVRDQIKHLKNAIELTMEMKSQRQAASISASPSMPNLNGVSADSSSNTSEAEEMQEQIVKLKALLSTKREQIATLRTVLKANKQTAEVALANLKSKYETEKAVVTETMTKLRNELKALKEDAATFASLRSMFAARCEEYSTQIDELQRQLQASEVENIVSVSH
ncbi:Protein bicaudal D [Halotydeus destructor]|nr:Protein bicaudal D [Halotydeus destructor]